MTSKAMFTDDEWHTLQWAVTDTMTYVSMADSGFWDTFKEATAAAKFMAEAKSDSDSPLVHDLAGDIKIGRDKAVTHDVADMAGEVAARVRAGGRRSSPPSRPRTSPPSRASSSASRRRPPRPPRASSEHEAAAIENLQDALG